MNALSLQFLSTLPTLLINLSLLGMRGLSMLH
ncbi:hypothetical protein NS506_07798 [Nocardia seriolae]|uniref:Uncharacterized protein n=1 Tax=Nocardia seriolae TaxID=37332 RepID=A0ABC8B633_9NOCA|nr:hypothetical protein NS506_07798 [Nocardia seriolae]